MWSFIAVCHVLCTINDLLLQLSLRKFFLTLFSLLMQDNLASAPGDRRGGNSRTSVGDVSGQTAPAAFSLLSLHSANQLWPNSAPELLTIEPINPTGSNSASYAEVLASRVLAPEWYYPFVTVQIFHSFFPIHCSHVWFNKSVKNPGVSRVLLCARVSSMTINSTTLSVQSKTTLVARRSHLHRTWSDCVHLCSVIPIQINPCL